MSHEETKNFWQRFLEKPRQRKEFLKMSGKSLAGITVSSTVLGVLTGCDDEEVPSGVTGIALASGVLISDPNRCTGCRRCELKCTMVNDGKAHPATSRVKVDRNYAYGPENTGHYQNAVIVPDTCRQCDDAACMNACPVDAISAQEGTGTRVIDEATCIGCGACERACPFRMATVDQETNKSKKCFLCDGDPTCAKICPTGALKLVDWEEVYMEMYQNKELFL